MLKNAEQMLVDQNAAASVVVVLGMHRSGTSALTKALQVLGVSLSENLMPGGEFNPKGHWEDLDVVSINDRLLLEYGAIWSSPTWVEVDFNSQLVALLLDEAVDLIKRRTNEFNLWGFKDPRTSRLLSFWQEAFKVAQVQAKYVYALRNPLDIARSLARRDGFSHKHSFLLWLMHTLPNLSLLADESVEFITFSALLTNPHDVIERLSKQLGFSVVDEDNCKEFIDEFIDPSLSHSDAKLTDLFSDDAYFEPILPLYAALDKLAKNESCFKEWLSSSPTQELLERYRDVFLQEQSSLLAEFNVSSGEYRAKLFHAELRVEQLEAHSRNKQAELQNLVQELQETICAKDAQLIEINNQLVDTNHAYQSSQMALEQTQHQLSKEEKLGAELAQRVAHAEQWAIALQEAVSEMQRSTSWRLTAPVRAIRPVFARPMHITKRMFTLIRHHGGVRNAANKAWNVYQREGVKGVVRRSKYQVAQPISFSTEPLLDYGQWLLKYGELSDIQTKQVVDRIGSLEYKPKISVLMPVYNPPIRYLCEAIDSVIDQLYSEWELCIVDDVSPNQDVRNVLHEYALKDARIKVIERQVNGHISEATNSALDVATGDYIALMDHDDKLPSDSLYWVAETILANPDVELIYSDEDKITADGHTRYDPNFKSQWNPELFLSQNCISHLGVYKTKLAKEIGGFRKGFEGAQDWDFALRFTEKVKPEQIIHIPRILYHWRAIEGSTAVDGGEKPYALDAAVRAVQEHFDRQDVKAIAEQHPELDYVRVRYQLPTHQPLVSMIIPTRNGLDVLSVCIDSILEKTTYKNYEIIIVDNGSDCPDTLEYLKTIQNKYINVTVLTDDSPFNYSALNNKAAAIAKGEILALVNNDVEVITPEWLTEMVGHAIQPQNGAVGARLWYPDDTLQHGGVIMVGGVAGHAHKHLPKGLPGYACRAIVSQNYSAVTAACLLVRRDVFEQVGGLNEKDLTVAFNDIDFCLKVQEAGYLNVWTPYAELYHYESKTRGFEDTPEKKQRFEKEVQYMRGRWAHILDADPYYNPNLTMAREDFSLAFERRV
ncbi:glycosyltransferase [Vibrio fluvialis]|nr:glycosyltransferase [Vibrio fluvialis]MBY7940813.1 glycosyltransferase [Vibrio fluvialis]MBY8167383.1 glycosyltransferase [Vibrio fluvialis]